MRDPDVVSPIAGRLARLDRVISADDRSRLADAADGITLTDLVRVLTNAVDIDAACALATCAARTVARSR